VTANDQPVAGRVGITVVLPSRSDPRLRVSAVITALQVLGQTVLGFKVSIAQILVSIGVCALVEAIGMLWRQRILAWPASGILTGSSVAFILRASGTRHGDWWSLHGIQYFVLAGVLSLLSKYLIRPGGRHLFNPSNVGLVGSLLVIGPKRVFPQYLWWGAMRPPVVAAMVVILIGGYWVLRPLHMIPMAASFLATFAALIGVLAAEGRSFFAIWHTGPVRGGAYWLNLCISPELLVFVFFMISDPATAPRQPRARLIYGSAVALVAAGLISFQPTEFGIKMGILSGLTAVSALVPWIEGLSDRSGHAAPASMVRPTRAFGRRPASAATRPAVVAAVAVALAALVGTAVLAGNEQVAKIERGLAGPNAQ
jgi:Na+-translocating ferredoxin:NAD+ oxidoreductase RnfD subunit